MVDRADQLRQAGNAACVHRRRIGPAAGQHRVEREADEQRHQHGHRDGDAERVKELADDAAHEGHRHEHRADREGGGHHRQADLLGALARRGEVVLAEVHVAHDVLAHHDRVVDQQSDAQRQRHHRHEVQREAEGMHGDEAGDHRDRQRAIRTKKALFYIYWLSYVLLLYQHHEVLLIRRIRELLYEHGFTINGARNRLEDSVPSRTGLPSPAQRDDGSPTIAGQYPQGTQGASSRCSTTSRPRDSRDSRVGGPPVRL